MTKKFERFAYTAVIVIGLLPTIALLVWGVYQSSKSGEFLKLHSFYQNE